MYIYIYIHIHIHIISIIIMNNPPGAPRYGSLRHSMGILHLGGPSSLAGAAAGDQHGSRDPRPSKKHRL